MLSVASLLASLHHKDAPAAPAIVAPAQTVASPVAASAAAIAEHVYTITVAPILPGDSVVRVKVDRVISEIPEEVKYTTVSGTAKAGVDYEGQAGFVLRNGQTFEISLKDLASAPERAFDFKVTSKLKGPKLLSPKIERVDLVAITLPAIMSAPAVSTPVTAAADAGSAGNENPAGEEAAANASADGTAGSGQNATSGSDAAATAPADSATADAPPAAKPTGSQRLASLFSSAQASVRSFLASYVAKYASLKPDLASIANHFAPKPIDRHATNSQAAPFADEAPTGAAPSTAGSTGDVSGVVSDGDEALPADDGLDVTSAVAETKAAPSLIARNHSPLVAFSSFERGLVRLITLTPHTGVAYLRSHALANSDIAGFLNRADVQQRIGEFDGVQTSQTTALALQDDPSFRVGRPRFYLTRPRELSDLDARLDTTKTGVTFSGVAETARVAENKFFQDKGLNVQIPVVTHVGKETELLTGGLLHPNEIVLFSPIFIAIPYHHENEAALRVVGREITHNFDEEGPGEGTDEQDEFVTHDENNEYIVPGTTRPTGAAWLKQPTREGYDKVLIIADIPAIAMSLVSGDEVLFNFAHQTYVVLDGEGNKVRTVTNDFEMILGADDGDDFFWSVPNRFHPVAMHPFLTE